MHLYEIPFINLIIRTFDTRFQMTRQAAYDYLVKYDGLSFLDDGVALQLGRLRVHDDSA